MLSIACEDSLGLCRGRASHDWNMITIMSCVLFLFLRSRSHLIVVLRRSYYGNLGLDSYIITVGPTLRSHRLPPSSPALPGDSSGQCAATASLTARQQPWYQLRMPWSSLDWGSDQGSDLNWTSGLVQIRYKFTKFVGVWFGVYLVLDLLWTQSELKYICKTVSLPSVLHSQNTLQMEQDLHSTMVTNAQFRCTCHPIWKPYPYWVAHSNWIEN